MNIFSEYFEHFRKPRNRYAKGLAIFWLVVIILVVWTFGGMAVIISLKPDATPALYWLCLPWGIILALLADFAWWHAGRMDDGYFGSKYDTPEK